jgi:hypothetical protein
MKADLSMTQTVRTLLRYAEMMASLRASLRSELDRLRKERPPPEE